MFIDIIKQVMKKTKCRKDFKCLNDQLDNLCKMDYFTFKDANRDNENFECLEGNELDCDFRVPIADGFFCKCPVRIEILKQSRGKGK